MTQITTMPDLATLALSSSPTLTRCPSFKPASPLHPPPPPPGEDGDTTQLDSVKTLVRHCSLEVDDEEEEREESEGNGNSIRVLTKSKRGFNGTNSLEDYVQAWTSKRMALGAPQSRCFLPFLVGAKKMDECLACHSFIYPGEEVSCSVRGCEGVYHLSCAMGRLGVSHKKKFKCPQHECFFCKRKFHWRCTQCPIASHDGCSPWPDEVIHLVNQTGRAVCWRHPTNWRLAVKALADGLISLLNGQHVDPTSDMEEVFCRLPLPYNDEEFKIELSWKGTTDNKEEPPVPAPYIHIRRNIYLVKKKRSDDGVVGCTNCRTECCEDCVCRVQSISCSRACHCFENCSNRPFRKERKIKLVKTEFCGWGVEAAESINRGDFIVEYIGEVIDDALCEKRLWDMKYKGVQNFYMCEIRKDFTIDATFKGNLSRFLNHSCDPNCLLEKWQVEGETRVGVFAARAIEVGEPLTYDYRFVQFGPEVKCYCGAQNCQGYLGMKKKMVSRMNICWGAKRRRSSTACLAIIAL